jgi:KDO2-lipid IV(A) lauroyltransferase
VELIFGIILGVISWLFYLQPRSLRVFWGRSLGALLRWKGMRRGVIEQNLKIAFPAESEDFRRSLADRAYEHLGRLFLELVYLFGPLPSVIRNEAVLLGQENWRAANALGKGVIFISSHVGNWEIMSGSGAMLGGIPLMIVTKQLKPAWLHAIIERGRRRASYSATYEPRTMKDVLRHLNSGGTVGFVMDQYSGPPVGVRVPVFGVPVGTPAAIAMLAKRTGAPVLPVVNYRREDGKYVSDIRPEIAWKPAAEGEDPRIEIGENTARFAQVLEKDIYAHPEQWLWTHRRFKGDLGPLRSGEWLEGRSRR